MKPRPSFSTSRRGYRRGSEGGNLSPDARAVGLGGRVDLIRHGRGDRRLRPGCGDARGS
jgi:hypothetical protein